ncbi:MAG TPA: dihydroorotase family protein, partial [Spirochaetia bacterium]|nr:dihydroorotase family protein [Spirochaetia bacterium]
MQEAAASRLPVLVHAEDYDYVTNATREAMNEGSQPIHFYRSRPEIAERLAVLAALEIAEETGGDLHVVHIGTAQAARHFKRSALVKDNGKEAAPGPRMTCETGPHYLHFDVEDFQAMGSSLKVTPPVKTPPNKQQLWDLLSDGTISFVASDHAPCQEQEKRTGSIWTDYSGIPGCGTLLPFTFSEGYGRGRLTLKRLLEVTSENAARRYGLFHRKGSIETGKDADLVIIDPDAQWKVEGARSYSKGKITPFEGLVFRGRVLKTILRGRVIYDSERGVLAERGAGQFLRRQSR